jgi:hypothetical protein
MAKKPMNKGDKYCLITVGVILGITVIFGIDSFVFDIIPGFDILSIIPCPFLRGLAGYEV